MSPFNSPAAFEDNPMLMAQTLDDNSKRSAPRCWFLCRHRGSCHVHVGRRHIEILRAHRLQLRGALRFSRQRPLFEAKSFCTVELHGITIEAFKSSFREAALNLATESWPWADSQKRRGKDKIKCRLALLKSAAKSRGPSSGAGRASVGAVEDPSQAHLQTFLHVPARQRLANGAAPCPS